MARKGEKLIYTGGEGVPSKLEEEQREQFDEEAKKAVRQELEEEEKDDEQTPDDGMRKERLSSAEKRREFSELQRKAVRLGVVSTREQAKDLGLSNLREIVKQEEEKAMREEGRVEARKKMNEEVKQEINDERKEKSEKDDIKDFSDAADEDVIIKTTIEHAIDSGIITKEESKNLTVEDLMKRVTQAEKEKIEEYEDEQAEPSETEKEIKEEKRKETSQYMTMARDEFGKTEDFTMEGSLIADIDGVFNWKRNELIVENGREYLFAEASIDSKHVGILPQDVKHLSDAEVLDKVKEIPSFEEENMGNDERWKKIINLSQEMKEPGSDSDARIKEMIFKELTDEIETYSKEIGTIGNDPKKTDRRIELEARIKRCKEVRSKVWEKVHGENLSKTAAKELKLGSCEEYVDREIQNFEAEENIKFFQDKWTGLSKEAKTNFGNDINNYVQQELSRLKDTLNTNLKGVKNIEESDIIALLEAGTSIEIIEKLRKPKIRIPLTKPKIKIGGFFGDKIPVSEFEDFILSGNNKRNSKIEDEKVSLEQNYNKKITKKSEEIIGIDARSEKWELLEEAHADLAKKRTERFLAKKINRNPERRKKIEQEFGKLKKEDINDKIKKTMEKQEQGDLKLEDMSDWGVDIERLPKKDRESFRRASKTVGGLFDWIFKIMFAKK